MKILTDREKDLSGQIVTFLKERPLVSILGLEKLAGVSPRAITKAIKADNVHISPRHIFNIIRLLASYGLTIDGYRLEVDDESPAIFLKKDVGEAEMEEINEGTRSYFVYKQVQSRSIVGDLVDLL